MKRVSRILQAVLRFALPGVMLAGGAAAELAGGPEAGKAVRPADELFWTPTLEQGMLMAEANHVPVFVMGYSLVGDKSTYTKFGEDCASTVF